MLSSGVVLLPDPKLTLNRYAAQSNSKLTADSLLEQ
jgi:hypothetical protein